MATFSQVFKKLREKKGWTQEEIADKLGVSRPSITGYETKNRRPRHEMLHKIADLFGVSTDYLLGREDNDPVATSPHPLDAITELIKYLELELSSEEIVGMLNFKVDNIALTKEEALEFVEHVRFKRFMKKKQESEAASSKGKGF